MELFEDELWKLHANPLDLLGVPEKLQSSFRLALEGKTPFEGQAFADAFQEAFGPKEDNRSETERIKEENDALLKEFGAVPTWELDKALTEEMRLLQIQSDMIHEALNVYSVTGAVAPYLSPTWYAFLEDQMDDIKEKAGESLDKPLFERLNIRPVVISEGEQEKIFLARFEFPKYMAPLMHPDADLNLNLGMCLAWIDFLSGFHFGDTEMLVVVGEVSTKDDEFPAIASDDSPVPPMPEELFDETYTDEKILHTLNWLEADFTDGLADGVSGETEPAGPHWWFRVNCQEKHKWPYPGEFLGMANRIFPNLTWSISDKTPGFHPFLFSGMFMDTVYITSGQVTEVEETSEGYCKVKVRWREKEIWAYPTDFAKYEVDDRVTIIKDVTTIKTSERWKDEDLWSFDEEIWRVVPLTYYGKGFGEE